MSHHKRPIKPLITESQLFISHGFLLDRDFDFFPSPGYQQNHIPSLPARPMLYHPFTSQINLLLSDNLKIDASSSKNKSSSDLHPPDLEKIPDLLKKISDLGSFQYISNFNLADLLDVTFAQTYLRSGSLVAMSVSRMVGDDMFAIDGHGTIHMRLNQSTYQTLGLPGRQSKFGPAGQHFVVEVDMRNPTMQSGKPNYERTRKCLDNFPSSMFGDLLGPKYEFNRGRRWEVVMSWVDEQGKLQPIQALPTATMQTRSPEINQTKKVIPYICTPDIANCAVETLLDLYEHVGEANLPTEELPEERYSTKGGIRTSAITIEATGFFHPFKLAELSQTLIKAYSIISITAHTAQFSPFSFLINRMTKSPRTTDLETNERGQKNKKKKKGKSVMRGPERGMDAGPTSWTFITFEDSPIVIDDNGDTQENFVQESSDAQHPDQPATRTDCTLRNPKRIKFDKDTPPVDLEGTSTSSLSTKCPWLIFESVGYHDTHC